MTELEKLDAGLPFDVNDPEVDARKIHAVKGCGSGRNKRCAGQHSCGRSSGEKNQGFGKRRGELEN